MLNFVAKSRRVTAFSNIPIRHFANKQGVKINEKWA